jgi:hypothetical protein
MRPIFLLLLVAGIGIIAWMILSRPVEKAPAPRQQAIAVSKHSESFNNAVSSLLSNYNKLSENFVSWDSAAAQSNAATLMENITALPLEELKKDSGGIFETASLFIENAKGNAQAINSEKSIRPQREAFNEMTDNLYQLLNTVRYDREVLFLQECPMAFDDTKAAFWLSEKEEIRNPYLGLHHPTYGKGMLKCGETKTKMNHTGANE